VLEEQGKAYPKKGLTGAVFGYVFEHGYRILKEDNNGKSSLMMVLPA
jgi:hypothetical protein